MTKRDDTVVDYDNSAFAVREDLVAAHEQMLLHLAAPGTWWSGSQRCEIARAARAARGCALCAERKAALSPFSVDGVHDDASALDPAVLDIVHRIVTDPGRLSRSWYEGLLAAGTVDAEHYVELVAVTVFTNALDIFARAVGVESQTLPEAQEGEPARVRPQSARVEGAWVPQIPSGEEGGVDWRAVYEDRTDVPQIGRALSLVPAEVDILNAMSSAHYMHLDHVSDPGYSEPDRAIDRLQMELVASRVSAINECFY